MNLRAWIVLLGQTGALLGAGLTAFALGLWSLSVDGSLTNFALLAAASTLPGAVLAPLAGVLAERASPRAALLAANAASVVSTTIIAVAVYFGAAPGAWVLVCLLLGGVGFGLQWPIYQKGLLRLIDDDAGRKRAAALLQLGPLAQHVVAPACAALLVSTIGTVEVLGLDVVLGVLAMTSSLALPAIAADKNAGGLDEAIAHLRKKPALVKLQLFFFCSYVFGAVLQSLSTPLLLSVLDAAQAGLLLSATGVGMLAGVVIATVVVVTRAIRGVVWLEAGGGLCLIGMGLWPTAPGIFVSASLFLLMMAWSNALSQRAWQQAVPSSLQVRVFAIRRMLSFAAFPVCFIVSGPAADLAVASSSTRTAGLALVFVIAGVGKVIVSAVAVRQRWPAAIDDDA
ncbi:MAG TPA: MFS transporter [Myxococcota bacterium]